jgi:hypothetical protein
MNDMSSMWNCIVEPIFKFWTFMTGVKAESWSAIASIVSVVIALGALWYTRKQWEKINAKIAMVEDSGKVAEILPAWYTRRMMRDTWLFGLYTCDGRVVLITSIAAVSDDGAWLDVELADPDTGNELKTKFPDCIYSVDEQRTRASVRVDSIVSAVDLQSS